jgi:hypothetical protein
MSWNPAHLQLVLDQVLGDPFHRERCIWLGDEGNHCQNAVPLASRINGVLCVQLPQAPPLVYPLAQEVSSAAKQLLCFECKTSSLSVKSVGHPIFESVGSSQRCHGSLGTSRFGSIGTSMANQHVPQCRHGRLPQCVFPKAGRGRLAKKPN